LANGLVVSEHQYHKNQLVSAIWPWVQFLDVVLLAGLLVKLPLWLGSTVVCDRFIPDTLVGIMIDVNDDRLCEQLVGRLMLRLMPGSSLVILLNVDAKTAWQRKNDVPNLISLRRKIKGYHVISRFLRIPVVNAEESVLCVQRSLLSIVDGSNEKCLRDPCQS
jgi:thymidylate kinase